ncbi:protein LNK3 isoform X2 [Spinacia oleracea]|uniref:Protein LNK3 isoform X2 n=1 Tax=Spinacia oleracea TaxID=3562 RepID=A0ABM3R2Y7_SPIOL|nr:protein LNK3-like isoform X2 [Spinacia oleracea]
MTEWYYGHDGHLVFQKEQEYFSTLPSSDSWMQWESSEIGGNSGWENSFDSGNVANEKQQQQTLFTSRGGNKQVDGELSYESNDFRGSSEDSHSLRRNSAASVRPDYYYNNLAETDSADDIFLSSLLEDDVLPTQSLYIGVPSNSHSTNNMMDFQSNSCDTDGVGSLKCFKNANNGYAHLSKRTSRNNSDQTCPSVKETMGVVPCDYEAPMRTSEDDDMSSTEESVLMGLEAVLNQLSETTRLCLRDSMYRLAEHSEQETSKNSLAEGLSLDEPSLPETSGVCSRSRMMDTSESETNAIDRAVAYMMFNKVDANEQEYVPADLSPEYVQDGRDFSSTRNMEAPDLFCQQTQVHQSYQSDFCAAENRY